MKSDWQWFGNAAHLIVADKCRFHLATLVRGHWLVSTVGEYYPSKERGMTTIGGGDNDYYETMIFECARGTRCECGCGLPIPDSWSELSCVRHANAKEANAGHLLACEAADCDAPDWGTLRD